MGCKDPVGLILFSFVTTTLHQANEVAIISTTVVGAVG
jgi:hypothetical protein